MSERRIEWTRRCVRPPKTEAVTETTTPTTITVTSIFDMGRGSSPDHDEPAVTVVLQSLDDEKCRAILTSLDEPKSANTLCEECGFPSSTMYRKLELLREAELVREYTEVRRDGPNATLYERDFTDISVGIDDSDEFTVTIDRPEERPEDRLATFWTEMRKES